jgi:O-antigen ligase
MLVVIVLSTIVADSDLASMLAGNQGRYNGVITSCCLILLLWVIFSDQRIKGEFFFWPLILSGVFQICYGILQALKLDPVIWENPFNYNPIFGTFGNPNHFSAFVGFFLVALLSNRHFVVLRLGILKANLIIVFSLGAGSFTLLRNESLQGLLVFVVGIGVYVIFFVIRLERLWERIVFFSIIFLISPFLYLGFLGLGPLGSILSTESGIYRSEYLSIGLRIIQSHIAFGIGADSYEEYFRSFKPIKFDLDRGQSLNVDSSHNLLIDMGLNFGLIFLILFLGLTVLCLYSGVKFETSEPVDDSRMVLLPMFITIFLQSLVSTPYVTHQFWLWVLMALMLRKIASHRDSQSTKILVKTLFTKKISPLKTVRKLSEAILVVSQIVIISVLFLFSFQISTHEYRFQRAILNKDGESLIAMSESNWLTPAQSRYTVQVVYQAGLFQQARKLNEELFSRYPRDFELALLLYEQLTRHQSNDLSSIKAIISRIKAIDPSWKPKFSSEP